MSIRSAYVSYELLTGTNALRQGDPQQSRPGQDAPDDPRRRAPGPESARMSTLQATKPCPPISQKRSVDPRRMSATAPRRAGLDRDESPWQRTGIGATRRPTTWRPMWSGTSATRRFRLVHLPLHIASPSSPARNQAALAASALVALALIAGTGVSIWQAIRATNAEVAATTEATDEEGNSKLCEQPTRSSGPPRPCGRPRIACNSVGRPWTTMYTQVAEKWLAQQAELTQSCRSSS